MTDWNTRLLIDIALIALWVILSTVFLYLVYVEVTRLFEERQYRRVHVNESIGLNNTRQETEV